jgi:hypothetical protein
VEAVQDVGNPTKEPQPSNGQHLRSARASGAAHTAGIPVVRFNAPGPRTLQSVQARDEVGVRLGIGVRIGGGDLIGNSEERFQVPIEAGRDLAKLAGETLGDRRPRSGNLLAGDLTLARVARAQTLEPRLGGLALRTANA